MQQIQNQIKIALLAIVRLLWMLVKGIGQLLIKGVTYVYDHRVQIIQYRYTLTIVMALSVAWASYRTYNYFTEPALVDAADLIFNWFPLPNQLPVIQPDWWMNLHYHWPAKSFAGAGARSRTDIQLVSRSRRHL